MVLQTHAFTPLDAVLAHFYLQCLAIPFLARGINNHTTKHPSYPYGVACEPSVLAKRSMRCLTIFAVLAWWQEWRRLLRGWKKNHPKSYFSFQLAILDYRRWVKMSPPQMNISYQRVEGWHQDFFWSSRSDGFFCSVVQSNAFAMTVGLVDTYLMYWKNPTPIWWAGDIDSCSIAT